MKIVSLVDNISNIKGIGCEHGLSFYIETTNHKILFDLGAGDLYYNNAQALGINLSLVDTVVISHGHYDHGGGLNHFLTINKKAKIYIKKEAFNEYYSIREQGTEYIGLDKSLSNNPRIIFSGNYLLIDEELQLFSEVKAWEEKFLLNKQLKEKNGEEYKNDDFLHEQHLIITEKGKKVLIAGCAHSGIINIIKAFIIKTGGQPHYVFGGYHLSGSGGKYESLAVINNLGQRLSKWDTNYYTCHCTGEQPYLMLKEVLGDQINYLSAGQEFNT